MAGETDISICSSALILLGQPAIASFTEDSDAARTCAQLYPTQKAALLAAYPWAFSKKKVQLARLVAVPISGWSYQYTMPTDRVGEAFAVFNSASVGARPILDFDVQGGRLLANHAELWLDYQYNVTEADMPAHFVQLLVFVLASIFAEPVTEVTAKSAYWHTVAYGNPEENMRGGYFRTAVGIDGRGRPNQAINTDELLNVRFA
jgi:hypothetical protein